MLLRTKLKYAAMTLGLLTALGAAVQAQQTTTQTPVQGPERMGRGEGRGFRRGPGRGGFGPRIIHELNLTDAQKQQARSIIQQSLANNKTTREELRQLAEKRRQGTLTTDDQARAKVLHEQMGAARKETETKMASLLTTEQKAKAEELLKDRKTNDGRLGGRRRGFPGKRGPGAPPPQKPSNPPANP